MVVAKYPATFGHTSVINYLCKELNELGYRAAIGSFSFDSNPPFNIEKIKLPDINQLVRSVQNFTNIFDLNNPLFHNKTMSITLLMLSQRIITIPKSKLQGL